MLDYINVKLAHLLIPVAKAFGRKQKTRRPPFKE